MYPTTLICVAFVAFCGVTSAQMLSRYRSGCVPVPVAAPVIQPCGCGSPNPDICTLIQLANALNGQTSGIGSSSGLNVDDMITKLLDALLTATVGGSGTGTGSTSGTSNNAGTSTTGGTGSSSQSSNPIIGLNLLGPNGLLAGLGIGGTKVLDVSTGGQNAQSGLTGTLENLLGSGAGL